MGGRGSGRRPGDGGKAETKGALQLEINKLTRLKLLVPGKHQFRHWSVRDHAVGSLSVSVESGGMTVFFHLLNPDRIIQHWVDTQTTSCTLGGHRYWFTCPHCDRRVAILYWVNEEFACRHCHDLAYACQKEGAGDRAIRQADKIRERLRWVPGIAHGHGNKPYGMHWKTFWRLKVEHEALAMVGCRDIARRLGFLHRLPAG